MKFIRNNTKTINFLGIGRNKPPVSIFYSPNLELHLKRSLIFLGMLKALLSATDKPSVFPASKQILMTQDAIGNLSGNGI